MDILKEIISKPKSTIITELDVQIDNKKINKNTVVEIGDQKKQYTVEQLAYFIVNKDLMYTQYLKKCKEQNIGPIFYTDQKIIFEELQKFREEMPQYHFGLPEDKYLSKNDYSWIKKFFNEKEDKPIIRSDNEPFKIVVPSSIASLINLSNIEHFLKNGEVVKNNTLILDKVETFFNGKLFVIEDTIIDWTSDDWKRLVGIFVDGSSWQVAEWKIGDIAGLFSKIPVFYLYEEGNETTEALDGYKINRIKLTNKKCKKEDLENVLNSITEICDSPDNGL
ncbi:Cell division cycle protein 73 [Nosema granulosis]|uniref:Cell division cycle protein 73 n=1 Tax=Nosema granulosis TaxID=83296 RepID=A0A9P6GY51_9MICR|nr:Cell division cycle protein 73 [Nosema granulosis]